MYGWDQNERPLVERKCDGRVSMEIIARIQTEFPTKFGVPRQSGLIDELEGRIVFESAFRNPDCVRGLEGFSHIWLIWGFSQARREGWSATVRPPRLGGNARVGVFATRSPFRPNSIGLSSVRLLGIETDASQGPVLRVSGADLVNGTPIYDIKPYLAFTDSHPDAVGGFAEAAKDHALQVRFPDDLLSQVPETARKPLLAVLAQDPRPSYQDVPERRYGVRFGKQDIRFTVKDGILTVCEVEAYIGE